MRVQTIIILPQVLLVVRVSKVEEGVHTAEPSRVVYSLHAGCLYLTGGVFLRTSTRRIYLQLNMGTRTQILASTINRALSGSQTAFGDTDESTLVVVY